MKVRMNFGIVKTIFVIAIVLAGLALVAIDIYVLAKPNSIDATVPAIAGVSLGASVLIVVVAMLVLLNSFYKFEDDRYIVMLGMFKDCVKYDNIVCIKQNIKTKEIFAIVAGNKPTDGAVGYRINVAPQNVDVFLASLREHKSDIVIEFFEPENKEKTKK